MVDRTLGTTNITACTDHHVAVLYVTLLEAHFQDFTVGGLAHRGKTCEFKRLRSYSKEAYPEEEREALFERIEYLIQ